MENMLREKADKDIGMHLPPLQVPISLPLIFLGKLLARSSIATAS